MYKIVITNRNGRILREVPNVTLPEDTEELRERLDLIGIGAGAACCMGVIEVYDEETQKLVTEKLFISKR